MNTKVGMLQHVTKASGCGILIVSHGFAIFLCCMGGCYFLFKINYEVKGKHGERKIHDYGNPEAFLNQ